MESQLYEALELDGKQCENSLHVIDDALYVLGGKWKLRIISGLSHGRIRFNNLQRLLNGISARVLSAELKELEVTGLVRKIVSPLRPAATEYELTEYSGSLSAVFKALHEWGAMHRERIRTREFSVQS